MYRANLSWSRLTKQLEFLLEQELLEKTEENGTVYRITLKGKEILEYSIKIERNLYLEERILPIQVYVQNKRSYSASVFTSYDNPDHQLTRLSLMKDARLS